MVPTTSCWLFLVLVVGGWALCPFHRRPSTSQSNNVWMSQIWEATDDSDPLVRANNMFHGMYSQSGNNMLPAALVVQENDYLVLLRRDAQGNFTRVRSDPIIPPSYHNLKMVCHMPLAVFTMLLPYANGLAPFPTDSAIAFKLELDTASATINATRFPDPAQLARQIGLMSSTMAFLQTALTQHNMSLDQLLAFTRGLAPAINANVADAARAQIDLLMQVMTTWRQTVLAPSEWTGLRFIAHSSHMAATSGLVNQVFTRMLSANPRQPDMGPNDPNKRFISLDDIIMDEQSAQTLLATHYTDYAIGDAFFGSPYRMHRDLLGDAAEQYLNALFPPMP